MTQETGKLPGSDKVLGCTDQMRSGNVKRRHVYYCVDSASSGTKEQGRVCKQREALIGEVSNT